MKPAGPGLTGVGRVVEGVLTGLDGIDHADLELRLLSPQPGARTMPWVQLSLPWRARGADVLYCPFYYRPLISACPVVVAIFDVLVLTHPEWFPVRGRHPFSELLLWSARRGAAVVTASQAVLAEIESMAGPLEERGTVVPLGVDGEHFRPRTSEETAAVLQRLGVAGPYLLATGSLHPRRGVDVALAALQELLPRWPDLRLVLVGRPEQRWGQVPDRLSGQVVLTGYIPDEDLPPLMSGAAAILSLSRGEGFDLPLLEGLACGAPVVASDIAVHREHFEQWARFVPVGDAEAVASAAEDLLRHSPSAEDRGDQAFEVRSCFRWEDSARAHLEVWRRAAERGKGR
jgi:glycosyltransferase involved in cell wall biosynthesis